MSRIIDAMNLEARAMRHRIKGRYDDARNAYEEAAALFDAVADRAGRYGETAIASIWRREAERARRKADAVIWEAIP